MHTKFIMEKLAGKTPLGRPRDMWKGNTKIDLKG
jgi:hypothetical protein